MHPTFLDSMSWEMAEVYGAITDQILINLARHFPFYDAGDPLPKSAFEYQARMLAQMGQVSKETMQIIRNGLSDADLALQGVLEQAVIDAVKTSEPELLEAVKKGVLTPATMPAVVAPNQTRAFQLYYQQASEKLNLVNTVMLESTKSAYQQTISDVVSEIDLADRMNRTQIALDVATGETITGVSTWNQALRHATDRLKEGGVVGFVDHGGHQWSAEAYVAMDIRTTVFNTGRAATWEVNQDFGNDLYLVSYHNGARPLCFPWQNKVISSTDNARIVRDLDGNEIEVIAQSTTSYGEAAGLFGINCRHYPTPFIPGVSVADGKPQDKEENDRVYAESQEQRRLERKLREEKRDLLMAKAQGASDEEIAKLREKTRKSSQDIDDFCKETGRARHRDREAVYTKREFPDKERYDVSKFETEQKKLIDDYYRKGGEQQGYTFGEMTPNEPQTNFPQAKTQAEAEAYAKEHFARFVDFNGISVEKCNAFNETLQELTEKYPTEKLAYIKKGNYRGGSTAWANGSEIVHAGKNIDKNYDSDWEKLRKDYASAAEAYRSSYEGRKMPQSIARTVREYERLAMFDRYGYGKNSVHDIIVHEYGHVLADQRIGQINGRVYCKNKYSSECIKLQNLISETRKEVRKTGEIFNMSAYADKNDYEFFAESFTAYHLGNPLPQNVVTMVERVLSFGQV